MELASAPVEPESGLALLVLSVGIDCPLLINPINNYTYTRDPRLRRCLVNYFLSVLSSLMYCFQEYLKKLRLLGKELVPYLYIVFFGKKSSFSVSYCSVCEIVIKC